MAGKYRITIEYIADEKSVVILKEEYYKKEIDIKHEHFIEPRYEIGNISPIGFWDTGHSLMISAIHKKYPEAI